MTRSIDQDFDAFEAQYEATIKRAVAEVDARWSVTGYKGHNTRDGVAWVATLRLDGKPVGHLEDSGRGGGVDIDFYGKDGRNTVAEGLWKAEVTRILPDEGQYLGGETLAEALLQKAGR